MSEHKERKTLEERQQMSDLERLRHSCAHVLATAICRLWPDAQLAGGPAVDNGFYYDVELDHRTSTEDLERIEDIKGDQKEIAWGSQIRSYVFMPYTLAKDHRTGFEMGNITAVMDGDIDGFINAYLKQKSAQEAEEKAEA